MSSTSHIPSYYPLGEYFSNAVVIDRHKFEQLIKVVAAAKNTIDEFSIGIVAANYGTYEMSKSQYTATMSARQQFDKALEELDG